jgi:hypothetical protein
MTSCECVPVTACLSLADCYEAAWGEYNDAARAVAFCASAGVSSGSGFDSLVLDFREACSRYYCLVELEPLVSAPWWSARLDGADDDL